MRAARYGVQDVSTALSGARCPRRRRRRGSVITFLARERERERLGGTNRPDVALTRIDYREAVRRLGRAREERYATLLATAQRGLPPPPSSSVSSLIRDSIMPIPFADVDRKFLGRVPFGVSRSRLLPPCDRITVIPIVCDRYGNRDDKVYGFSAKVDIIEAVFIRSLVARREE